MDLDCSQENHGVPHYTVCEKIVEAWIQIREYTSLLLKSWILDLHIFSLLVSACRFSVQGQHKWSPVHLQLNWLLETIMYWLCGVTICNQRVLQAKGCATDRLARRRQPSNYGHPAQPSYRRGEAIIIWLWKGAKKMPQYLCSDCFAQTSPAPNTFWPWKLNLRWKTSTKTLCIFSPPLPYYRNTLNLLPIRVHGLLRLHVCSCWHPSRVKTTL